MQKYFISASEFDRQCIRNEDVFHIRTVMRYKVGDLILVAYNSRSYLARLTMITDKEVSFEIVEEKTENREFPFFIHLFQGYPKGDKLENIIKYGTQLGVRAVCPVLMQYSVVKLEEKKKKAKQERFSKIAKEAAEQSFRNIVPRIDEVCRLKEIDFSSYDLKIVCYEEAAKSGEKSAFKQMVRQIKPNMNVAIIVGPEGGISPGELSYLEEQGFIKVGLGPRILRTETVVFYVLSAISYEWELKE